MVGPNLWVKMENWEHTHLQRLQGGLWHILGEPLAGDLPVSQGKPLAAQSGAGSSGVDGMVFFH